MGKIKDFFIPKKPAAPDSGSVAREHQAARKEYEAAHEAAKKDMGAPALTPSLTRLGKARERFFKAREASIDFVAKNRQDVPANRKR